VKRAIRSVTQAVSETTVVLSTGLVLYLSVNAVTHPATLGLQATHFAPWPTERALRVTALLLCICSVTILRYLLATPSVPADSIQSQRLVVNGAHRRRHPADPHRPV
jgi:TRAP-type C4-dicarboxylate transport system permease small subunit